ncbi:Phage regulatory protein Rha (Phage_pRha) [Thauera chlorobenzoica]|uniref:Phage regulatory protein n=2 Tax=Thauera chlorobenzoica TaxID=96773 RepID=A0A1H5Z7T2_9RHOO|nr:Rha family transcriptional regulator [Thauera chlorobenzoica]APR05652.1 phage regulatory protein [Thauera chlorobenzoica]SEG31657.1 Phage regulatory protein Rha (Phage_pRha) [Thauera chlorobenzoica]
MLPDLHMPEIVIERAGELVTTSLAIAEGTEVEHASVIKLVRKYLEDLEEFGRVGFEIRPFETAGGTQRQEIAFLNEPQATLLLTYMRNSDIVRGFKKALVRAFFDLRDSAAGVAAAPGLPTSVAHRADHIVAATRSFNGLLRAAQGLRLGHAHAARSANAATLRHTGIDLMEELGVTDADLAASAPAVSADTRLRAISHDDGTASRVSAWLDAPEQAARNHFESQDILSGAIGLTPGHSDFHGAQTRLGYIMARLGWRKQRMAKGARRYVYVRPEG